MILYDYFRSSASYRVRIALNLKKISYTQIPINLVNKEQLSDEYLLQNPQGLVPTLESDGCLLYQSISICEYLNEKFPEPSIIPEDINDRAFMRALVDIIACDIHPLNNLRVLNYLSDELDVLPDNKDKWYQHWLLKGLEAFEKHLELSNKSGTFCVGDRISIADIFLVPQLYNARRFDIDISHLKNIVRIDRNCASLKEINDAHP